MKVNSLPMKVAYLSIAIASGQASADAHQTNFRVAPDRAGTSDRASDDVYRIAHLDQYFKQIAMYRNEPSLAALESMRFLGISETNS